MRPNLEENDGAKLTKSCQSYGCSLVKQKCIGFNIWKVDLIEHHGNKNRFVKYTSISQSANVHPWALKLKKGKLDGPI